jgi:hypothetical protein
MPFNSTMRTDRDMNKQQNVEDALHEFDRCDTDDAYAAWAQKWGRAFCESKLDGMGFGRIPDEAIEAFQSGRGR